MKRPRNKHDWDALEADLRLYGSIGKVAEVYDCPACVVSRFARAQGLTWAFLHTNPEWLYQKYAVEGLSLIQISKLAGVSRGELSQEVRRLGVKIRTTYDVQRLPLICLQCEKVVYLPPHIHRLNTFCSIQCCNRHKRENGMQPFKDPKFNCGRTSPHEELLEPWLPEFKRQHPVQKWRPNKRKSVYRLDFALPEIRLGVEVDGTSHNKPERKKKDQERDEFLRAQGWTLLRFTNADVETRLAEVVQTIRHEEGVLRGRTQSIIHI